MVMLHIRRWSNAGLVQWYQPGWYKYKYNALSPKQCSKRVNSFTKTIHFAHLGILSIYAISLESLSGRGSGASAGGQPVQDSPGQAHAHRLLQPAR